MKNVASWNVVRWIVEPGHRSRQASWLPSVLLSCAAAAFTALPWLGAVVGPPQAWLFGFTYLLLAAAVAFRRHYPGVMLLLAVLACVLQVVLLAPVPSPIVLLIIYDYARWSSRYSWLALVAGLIGAVLGPAAWMLAGGLMRSVDPFASPLYFVLVVACAGAVVTPYVIARFRRAGADRARERQEREAERLRHALAEREHRARAAEANARNLIARELHDVVAHSLSVIVVQAEGGRAVAERRPEQAGEVLTTIAETSREALDEMRRIVGVLRDGPEAVGAPDYLPAPTLAEIRELVDRAGRRFKYTERGTPPAYASRTLQLSAYRIIQEAVTNVLKHAGPRASADVSVTYHPDAVELSIVDDGLGAAADNDLRGNGLRGMGERVHAMGGKLAAQPEPGGGFAVRAMLPINGSPAQPTDAQPELPSPVAMRSPGDRQRLWTSEGAP